MALASGVSSGHMVSGRGNKYGMKANNMHNLGVASALFVPVSHGKDSSEYSQSAYQSYMSEARSVRPSYRDHRHVKAPSNADV